jgi:hypothetical protein
VVLSFVSNEDVRASEVGLSIYIVVPVDSRMLTTHIGQVGNPQPLTEEPVGAVVSEFDVKKDERNRVTLKSVPFDYYHVKVFDDGHIEFYPQVLANASLSVRTLAMMDSAMENLARGKVSAPLDPHVILGDDGEEE